MREPNATVLKLMAGRSCVMGWGRWTATKPNTHTETESERARQRGSAEGEEEGGGARRKE